MSRLKLRLANSHSQVELIALVDAEGAFFQPRSAAVCQRTLAPPANRDRVDRSTHSGGPELVAGSATRQRTTGGRQRRQAAPGRGADCRNARAYTRTPVTRTGLRLQSGTAHWG